MLSTVFVIIYFYINFFSSRASTLNSQAGPKRKNTDGPKHLLMKTLLENLLHFIKTIEGFSEN